MTIVFDAKHLGSVHSRFVRNNLVAVGGLRDQNEQSLIASVCSVSYLTKCRLNRNLLTGRKGPWRVSVRARSYSTAIVVSWHA
jgi:hypothetical protein